MHVYLTTFLFFNRNIFRGKFAVPLQRQNYTFDKNNEGLLRTNAKPITCYFMKRVRTYEWC